MFQSSEMKIGYLLFYTYQTRLQMIGSQQVQRHIDLSVIGTAKKPDVPIDALIVLNSDISEILLDYFVEVSHSIILCDGGANFFYDSKHRDAINLAAVVGDLDSIRNTVRHYFASKVEVQDLSADQDTNDFEKGLNYALQKGCKTIVCLGILGGRFDQEMCNLSVLQKYSRQYPDSQFIAGGTSSIICVVRPNTKTNIRVGKQFVKDQAGMIVFGKAKVETKGFKWNLGKEAGLEELQWGTLVSSSNKIEQDRVEITSSHTLFFTIELNPSEK